MVPITHSSTNRSSPWAPIDATLSVLEALASAGKRPAVFLFRQQGGDSGDLSADDRRENKAPSAAFSHSAPPTYLNWGVRIWDITEAGRSAVSSLLPSDY